MRILLTVPTEYARCETVLAAALDDMVRALEIALAECVEFVNSR